MNNPIKKPANAPKSHGEANPESSNPPSSTGSLGDLFSDGELGVGTVSCVGEPVSLIDAVSGLFDAA